MVPWLNFDDILERRRSYDPVRFRNEAMGLPTVLGDHVVTLQELQECCADRKMARTLEMIPRNCACTLNRRRRLGRRRQFTHRACHRQDAK